MTDSEVAVLFIGGAWFLFCAWEAWRRHSMQTWPVTRGQLLEIDMTQAWGDFDPPVYQYQVDDVWYRGRNLRPDAPRETDIEAKWARIQAELLMLGDEDGNVDVYYNPRKPVRSFLQRPDRKLVWLWLLWGCMPWAAYLILPRLGIW